MERLKLVDATMFNNEIIANGDSPVYISVGTPNTIYLSADGETWKEVMRLRLNPDLPNVYSWFYNFADNGDGRIYGYITGIMREDNNQPLSHGTVILDLTRGYFI